MNFQNQYTILLYGMAIWRHDAQSCELLYPVCTPSDTEESGILRRNVMVFFHIALTNNGFLALDWEPAKICSVPLHIHI